MMIMPKLATTSWHRQDENAVPWSFSFGSVRVVAGVGETGASRSFFVAAPAGARLAWQRYRAGVRGMTRDCGSRSAQIGLAGTPTAGCVGPTGRRVAGQRRPKGRVCWLPCFRRHEHEAGGLQQIQALCTFTTWSCPVHPIRGTRPIDATNNNHRPTAAQQRAGRRRGRSTRRT